YLLLVSERDIDRAELLPTILLVEFGGALDLRVADAHTAEQDGEAGLRLADERAVPDAQAVAVGVAVQEDVACDRLATRSDEELPAEACATEALRARQCRPRSSRPEVVAQLLADPQCPASGGIGSNIADCDADPRYDIELELGIVEQNAVVGAPAPFEG